MISASAILLTASVLSFEELSSYFYLEFWFHFCPDGPGTAGFWKQITLCSWG